MSDRSSFLGRRSAVFVVLVASSMAACSASDTGEAWRHDFESAEAEARERGLPILLHFHASWCGPCRQMEATVLHDPSLLRQLRRGFVAVKVDAAVRKDLVERFKIERLPSAVFETPTLLPVPRPLRWPPRPGARASLYPFRSSTVPRWLRARPSQRR